MSKVFCIGLSRTGTTSVCEALNLLDVKTLHFSLTLFVSPEIIDPKLEFSSKRKRKGYKKWWFEKRLNVLKNKSPNSLLEQYQGFGDLPIPLYYKELDQKYPDSKFIYTYRYEEKWLNSMKWLFSDGAVLWEHGEIEDDLHYQTYNTYKFDREKLLTRYNQHHQDVLTYFKNRTKDVLILNIDQDKIRFDELCSFLGKPIPNATFPRSNAAKKPSRIQYINHWVKNNIPFYLPIYYKLKQLMHK